MRLRAGGASRLRGLLALLALACGGPAQVRYEDELTRAPAPAAHAVHEARLAELMRGLDRLRHERLPRDMDAETEREARAEQVARVADAMAASAREIPAVVEDTTLDDDQRRELQERADEMRRRAEALAAQARRRPPEDLREALAGLDATCNACHARYRAGGSRGADD